jgi:hypothetical protein
MVIDYRKIGKLDYLNVNFEQKYKDLGMYLFDHN